MPLVSVTAKKAVSWDFDVCIPRTYRVQGECKASGSDPGSPPPSPGCKSSDKQQYVANVVACSVEELAQRLKAMDMKGPVSNVSVYNAPVLKSDPHLDPTIGPHDLIDVTPILLGCTNWCDLLVDEDATQIISVSGYAMMVFSPPTGGAMVIESQANELWRVQASMDGSMTINSLSSYDCSDYAAAMDGSMTIVGSFGAMSSYYLYGGSGSMTIESGTIAGVSNYQYAGSGSMTMASQSSYSPTFSHTMSGSMRIRSLAGFAGRNFHFSTPAGGIMIINGLFKEFCSNYGAKMNGAMILSGSAGTNTSFFAATGSGAMRIVGLTKLGFRYGMSGSMRMPQGQDATIGDGGTAAPRWRAGHSASGVMRLTSSFGVLSPYYYYAGSGSMTIDSLADYDYSDLGTIDVDVGLQSFIVEPGIVFPSDPAPIVTPVVTLITVPCCVAPMPSLIQIKHNLLSIQALNRFLLRNGLTIDGDIASTTFITLRYSKKLGTWRASLHLRGLSSINEGVETWDFEFEFSCTDQLGGGTLGTNVWRFSSRTRLRRFMQNQDFDVRYVLDWRPETVCSGIPFSGFDFDFNFQNLTLTPTGANSPIFHDEGGLLTDSPSFSGSPVIQIRMSAAPTGPQQTYDWLQEAQLHEANHAADSSGHPL